MVGCVLKSRRMFLPTLNSKIPNYFLERCVLKAFQIFQGYQATKTHQLSYNTPVFRTHQNTSIFLALMCREHILKKEGSFFNPLFPYPFREILLSIRFTIYSVRVRVGDPGFQFWRPWVYYYAINSRICRSFSVLRWLSG